MGKMVADGRDAQRLHPEDLADIRRGIVREVREDFAALMRETQKDVPTYPSAPSKPPLYEGRSDHDAVAKMLSQAKDEIIRDVADLLRKAVEGFLTKQQIEEIIYDTFEDVGFAADTRENRRATGDRIRRILRWEKSANIVLGTAVISGLGSALYAVLKLIGFNPPPSGTH